VSDTYSSLDFIPIENKMLATWESDHINILAKLSIGHSTISSKWNDYILLKDLIDDRLASVMVTIVKLPEWNSADSIGYLKCNSTLNCIGLINNKVCNTCNEGSAGVFTYRFTLIVADCTMEIVLWVNGIIGSKLFFDQPFINIEERKNAKDEGKSYKEITEGIYNRPIRLLVRKTSRGYQVKDIIHLDYKDLSFFHGL